MPRDKRQNASVSTQAVCLFCGAGYTKYRSWQSFCSPKCRKKAWALSKRVGAYTDIRLTLAEILTRLRAIEEKIGIKLAILDDYEK
jgi:hypothetical protein